MSARLSHEPERAVYLVACRTARRWWQPSARLAVMLALAGMIGFGLGSTPQVQGIWFGAGYYANLWEESGGEKVNQLTVYASASDWFNCNASSCYSVPNYVSVTWSINDGYSDFEKLFGKHYGGAYCLAENTSVWAWASPANTYGTWNAYFSGNACFKFTTEWWSWHMGMCDTASQCHWFATHGPQISATLQPPSNSAFNFMYWWQ